MLKLSEAYGSFARMSVVADFLELAVLSGKVVTKAKVSDWLKDNGQFAILRPKLQRYGDEDPEGEDDEAQNLEDLGEAKDARFRDAAERVFQLLMERRNILRNRYPFSVTTDALSRRSSAKRSPYLALLSLTVAHAFRVNTAARPEELFEDMVAEAFVLRICPALNFGGLRRKTGQFRTALVQARKQLGFGQAAPTTVVHTFAHDEKADILGHLHFDDAVRRGRWIFIGQVTVGMSDSWMSKAKEPTLGSWEKLTAATLLPTPFLAIPHHIESRHMDEVLETQVMVLDRLRLTPFVRASSKRVRGIVSAVRAAGVEFP